MRRTTSGPATPPLPHYPASLRASCPEFLGWWAAHSIAAPVSGTKHLHHPKLGAVRYEYASFQANDDPALKLALYTRR